MSTTLLTIREADLEAVKKAIENGGTLDDDGGPGPVAGTLKISLDDPEGYQNAQLQDLAESGVAFFGSLGPADFGEYQFGPMLVASDGKTYATAACDDDRAGIMCPVEIRNGIIHLVQHETVRILEYARVFDAAKKALGI